MSPGARIAAALLTTFVAVSQARAVTERQRSLRAAGRGDARVYQLLRSDALDASGLTSVFVRASDDDARRSLSALGIEVPLGRWMPAKLDRAGIGAALVGRGALDIEVAPAHRPYLELSAREIGATDVQAGIGVAQSRTGRNVLIGIIDTGIDYHHPAFNDDDGRSRVIAVWDQDGKGSRPSGFGYGNECRESAIANGSCAIDDGNGHGTHVAGIAAGNGQLGGMAPHAKIAVVRSNNFTRLADAVEYLIGLAKDRDLPLVINLSVGGQYGAHDGATPLEEWLDDHLGDGRIVVAAAGNEGGSRLHAQAQLSSTERRLAVDNMPLGRQTTTHIDMWTPSSAQVSLAVELWIDGEPVSRLPLVARDNDVLEDSVREEGEYAVFFTYTAQQKNGRLHRQLVIDGASAKSLAGRAQAVLVLSGSGEFDAWVSQSDGGNAARFGNKGDANWIAGDGRESIAVPASARSVIAVGAYATRNTWTSEVDGSQQIEDLGLGRLAPYSSVGPTAAPERTGVKPDITAPGSVIISARARSVAEGPDVVDQHRMIMQGTSMASPHVAGVVALMLQASPKLSPADIRRIFLHTARADIATGSTPNAAYGLGKIDAKAAVAMAEGEPQGCAAAAVELWPACVAGLFLLTRRRRA